MQGDRELLRQEERVKLTRKEAAEHRATCNTFGNVDFQRTRFWCLASSVTVKFPRRLGDATPRQQTFDKRISRKVCNGYRQLWLLYHQNTSVPEPPDWSDWPITIIDPLMRQVGSTVIWERQLPILVDCVERRMERLADEYDQLTWRNTLRPWYNKHDMLLDWERECLFRILDFMTKRPVI